MKDKIFGVLQRIGRSFMLPIAILPIAGLFLGIGGSLTNATMLEAYNLVDVIGPGTFFYALMTVLNNCGNIVFANLPLLFAIGVAIGMAKNEKAVAAIASVIAFFVMNAAISAMIEIYGSSSLAGTTTSVCGINSLQTGVFGGIIVGLGVAALHNKFYQIELPKVFSFFEGTRFIPIISSITFLCVGILLYFIWPPIQNLMYKAGDLVTNSGYAGTFIYGLIERALIPFGLHHVFYTPFWQTAIGGTAVIEGTVVEGAQNIFFAELGANVSHFSVEATRFMSGKFPFMMFGLPGAALAMYKCADNNKKKEVAGLLFSAALTAFFTGITEPIEFTFLFLAPGLYVIHCVFAGLSFMIMHILNVGVGMTFSGGLIDFILYGVIQGNYKTNWIYIVLVGIVYFIVYYFVFSFFIKKFNIQTPGRGESENKLYTRSDIDAAKKKTAENENIEEVEESSEIEADPISKAIEIGLGGRKNISDLDCCATRLRISVYNPALIDETILKETGSAGVILKGSALQIVYGPRVSVIKSKLVEYIEALDKEEEEAQKKLLEVEQEKIAPKTKKGFGFKNNAEKTEEEPVENKEEPKEHEETLEEKLENENTIISVLTPIKGTTMQLEDLKDGVFSEGMLGSGIVIEPLEGKVYSPVDGTIANVFDTKHAISILSDTGIELLIHIGIDTVELNGQFFANFVSEGDKVAVGDLLLSFDMDSIKEAGYELSSPVVVTNSEEFESISSNKASSVYVFDPLLYITKRKK